ncbi:hypothetical protein CC78DRAFT_587612 [Lojkania enalia]|uniref:Uncharacterized protein n=1 Tax=Lojkania enalia TaxID=147567 RepID=A0A9P4K0Q5_9PLEO|nr:hypothetical protein CC78DRAFT_587612 [Didymosphaeria enalia]
MPVKLDTSKVLTGICHQVSAGFPFQGTRLLPEDTKGKLKNSGLHVRQDNKRRHILTSLRLMPRYEIVIKPFQPLSPASTTSYAIPILATSPSSPPFTDYKESVLKAGSVSTSTRPRPPPLRCFLTPPFWTAVFAQHLPVGECFYDTSIPSRNDSRRQLP